MAGRAERLYPSSLDVNLFCDSKGIIDLDTEVPHRALDLGVTKKQLHRSQIAGAPIDQGCLGSPQGMCTEQVRIQSDAGNPIGNKPCVLPRRQAPIPAASASE